MHVIIHVNTNVNYNWIRSTTSHNKQSSLCNIHTDQYTSIIISLGHEYKLQIVRVTNSQHIHSLTPSSSSATVESGQSIVKLQALFSSESNSTSGVLQVTNTVQSRAPFVCAVSRARQPTSHLLVIGDSHAGQYLRAIDRCTITTATTTTIIITDTSSHIGRMTRSRK